MHLAGKHVLITGSARRVGRAIAEALLAPERGPGVRLTAHYRSSRREADDLVAWGATKGREIEPIAADLRSLPSLRAMVSLATARFGPIDVLVNCASEFYPTPALSATEAQWDALFDTNLKGHFFLSQEVARTMQATGGVIVNIGDVNGERAMANYAPYCAAKAGLLHLTSCLAKEWAPKIRVNAVSPGAVLLPVDYTDEQKAKSIARAPLGRVGSPEDVAEGVRFLVENEYITGFVLNVDGGRSIG